MRPISQDLTYGEDFTLRVRQGFLERAEGRINITETLSALAQELEMQRPSPYRQFLCKLQYKMLVGGEGGRRGTGPSCPQVRPSPIPPLAGNSPLKVEGQRRSREGSRTEPALGPSLPRQGTAFSPAGLLFLNLSLIDNQALGQNLGQVSSGGVATTGLFLLAPVALGEGWDGGPPRKVKGRRQDGEIKF